MPVTPTYPGVYVEEIPSGVRTIVGVATSITAFIGRAVQGPANEPVIINSFGDFERTFGGLDVNYPMSYAVRDFYLNGGSQAVIVRLYRPFFKDETERQTAQTDAQAAADKVAQAATTAAGGQNATTKDVVDAANLAASQAGNKGTPARTAADAVAKAASDAAAVTTPAPTPASVAKAASDAVAGAVSSASARNAATVKVGNLTFEAASRGKWGNLLRVRVDNKVSEDVAKRFGLDKSKLFNLTVRDMRPGGATESFLNVTTEESPRRIDRVLAAQSSLLRVSDKPPLTQPTAHQDPTKPEEDIWADNKFSTPVTSGVATDSQSLDTATYQGSPNDKTGIFALDSTDLFNLLCIPPDTRDGDTDKSVYQSALAYCEKRRAMLIVDPPAAWSANKAIAAAAAVKGIDTLGLTGTQARNGAIFFPRVIQADPGREGQLDTFVPCGIIAGVMARTDTQRGVWKAPAGIDAAMNGIQGLDVNLSDAENGMLNPIGINCLRSFPIFGRVVWGARTLRGADIAADEYKYIPVRRTALFIEESLFRGLKWVVFEPNDEPLWAQIRLNVGAFMQNLFRQGAFQGKSPREAYFVKCDKETTTQNDINLGIVNVVVGFAPLKPAEFVIIKIQQMAGQIDV
ncbi:MAG: phage tail sheath family protein [Pyrinomonadaceae bacterium]|nr:phage tail sheath family protein [Pyrinomonadaceae bacterium]